MGDLSRLYADDCLRATADPDRYDAFVAYVSPGGLWRFPGDLSEESRRGGDARCRSPTPSACSLACVSTSSSRRCSACPG